MITNHTSIPTFIFTETSVTIKGRCILEDPSPVWSPFKVQLIEYIEKRKEVTIDFKLACFNTSSIMYLSVIFKVIGDMYLNRRIIINWYYLDMDEDMLEYGENFKEMTKHITFNFIPVQGQKLD
jgi:hypothetical protein